MNSTLNGIFNATWADWKKPINRVLTSSLVILLGSNHAAAQERWFQIEVSVFSNESTADRLEENWQPNRTNLSFPEDLIRLGEVTDILLIDEFIPVTEEALDEPLSPLEPEPLILAETESIATEEELLLEALLAAAPAPRKPGKAFKFFDLDRDDYLQLPAAQSDFSQTNRTLDRSPDHRLLWHSVWRQAVLAEADAKPIYVAGGRRFDQRPELEGSLTIRFNDNADRVVIDTNLWLTEYAQSQSSFELEPNQPEQANWHLPLKLGEEFSSKEQRLEAAGELAAGSFDIARIYQMVQSRDMRSNEFHYLDHPAIGIVVMVNPYEVPPVTSPSTAIDLEPELAQ